MTVHGATDLDLERRLEAFAAVRLSPDPRATARIRARVMREARLELEVGGAVARAAVAPRRQPLARRVFVPLLAAGLWLGIAVGTMAASQAGGPLYPTRLWIEQATLPTSATERIEAEIRHLESRLAEVMAAVAGGDRAAVAAALGAYDQQADQAIADAQIDEDLVALVSAALSRHLDVLTSVLDQVEAKGNDTAVNAIQANLERAIAHRDAVVERLEAAHGSGQPSESGSGDPSHGPAPGAAGQPSEPGGGGPTRTDPPAEPAETDVPAETEQPAESEKPDKSPKPAATPDSSPPPPPAHPTPKPGRGNGDQGED